MQQLNLFFFIAILLSICNWQCTKKEVSADRMVERGGLVYEINQEKPFSGVSSKLYANGQKKYDVSYQNGKRVSCNFWTNNGVKLNTTIMEVVRIKGGTFQMGDIWEDKSGDEKPVKVTLQDFELGKYEVTNAQFAAFLIEYESVTVKEGEYKDKRMIYEDDRGSLGLKQVNGQWLPAPGYENHPVVCVTWYGANEFAHYYGYRLPNEAEWEYAASWKNDGGKHKWAGTSEESKLGDFAWYTKNSSDLGQGHPDYGIHSVGQKNHSGLSLYDMSGNVWEWCADNLHRYADLSDEGKWLSVGDSQLKIIRGGSWNDDPDFCRSITRSWNRPGDIGSILGFRVAADVK